MANTVLMGGEFLVKYISPCDVFVTEDLSEEHRMIYKTANDFVERELLPNLDRIENQHEETIRTLFAKAGEIGLNSTDIPEAYGGLHLDKISTCLVAEAIGKSNSFAVSHGNHTGIASLPIVLFGTEEQKSAYLPKLASGEWIGAYCLTEAGAGSDALNSKTKAILSSNGKHYILNGEKVFVTNAAWADTFIVYAKVAGKDFTGFIVERSLPGISFGLEEKKMGIKGSSTRQVIFTDCPVPVENVLLGVGQGHKVAFNALNIGRYKVGAFTVGGCKKALSEAVRYANTRIQFSQPISSFGLIKEKLAGMFVDIYTNESLVYRVAGMIDDKLKLLTGPETRDGNKIASAIHEYAAECSICKVYGSEALNRCADEWIQILGGYGFCSEYGAERLYRDCRINRIFEGTNEINRLLIAGTLIKRAMTGKLPMQYQQGIADSGEMSLHSEINTIQEIKKLFLLVAGTCAARYQLELTAEQEVTALLSNMVIEIFTCESNLLRAEKASQSGSESSQYMKSASLIYLKESLTRIRCYLETIVARLGQDAESMVDQFNRAYDSVRTIDVIKEKRYVAEKVIGTERYFLD